MDVIGFLIFALVALVILYVAKLILDYCEADPPIRKVVLLILGLILLILLLNQIGFVGRRVVLL